MANPKVAWGIDIGNRALKAVKLARSGEGVVIQEVDVIEHENLLSNAGDNRDQLIQSALAVFMSKHQLKGAAAAVGVSGQQSFARFIKLPPVEEKKIPEIVRFEAIQQIPFPLDEVEWSYQLFREPENPDVEVGIFAMRRELVNQHLAFFTAAGLNVQAVQMTPLADYNALFYDEKLKGTTMVIDLGAENADLIIAEGENVWMRSIPIGGNHFTETLVRDFKLRFERAEELKRTTATSPHGRRILQAMRPVFADLVSEIQRSIGFYSSTHRDSRITKVLALGGTFRLPGLQKYLSQNLSLDVVKLDTLGQNPPKDGNVAATLNENVLSVVSAYGLALQALGEAKINSSLLPMAIQKERIWKDKIKYFAATAAMFVVGATIPYVVGQNQQAAYDSAESKAAQRDVDSTLASAKTLAGEWDAKQAAGAEDRKKIAEARTLSEYRDMQATLYDELMAALPKSKSVEARSAGETPKASAPAAVPPAARPAAPAAGAAGAAAKPPATVGDVAAAAEAVKKYGPRNKREEVVLEDLEMEYVPLIGELVAKNPAGAFLHGDDVFNARVGKRDPAALVGIRARHGLVGSTPGGVGVGAPMMPPGVYSPGMTPGYMPPAMMPGGTYDPNGGAVNAAGVPNRRGYLITLHLTTPNEGGIAFVSRAVLDKLMASEQVRQKIWDEYKKTAATPGKTPPRIAYSIARVTVPSGVRLKDDETRKLALFNRVKAARDRRMRTHSNQLNVPGVQGAAGQIDIRAMIPPPAVPGLGMPTDGGYAQPGFTPGVGIPMDPSGFGGTGGQLTQAEFEQFLVDPLTGEDARNDYIVTVLIAVVLDPFEETPPASGEDGAPPSDPGGGGSV